jgi:hypothetical protein
VVALAFGLMGITGAPHAVAATISFGGDLGTASSEGSCTAAPSTVTSDHDNSVEQNNPNSIKDPSHQDVHIRSKSGENNRGFINFPMPAVPAGCEVGGATLALTARTWDLGRTIQIQRAASSWTETTITWNNQPAATGPIATVSSGEFYSVEVSQQVRDMYTSGQFGFVLRDATEDGPGDSMQKPYSKEGSVLPALTISWQPANADSLAIPLASAVPAGSSVIVSLAMEDVSGAVSATDGAGNVYSVDAAASHEDVSRTVILSAHDVAPLLPGDSITISHPNTSSRSGSAAFYTGLAPVGALDASGDASGTDASPSSGAVTTAQADELVIGAITASGSATFTPGTGFTALSGSESGVGRLNPEYQIVSATGSYEANGTLSASGDWSAAVATYRMDVEAPSPAITQPPAATNDVTPTVEGTSGTYNSDSQTITLRIYEGPDISGVLLDTRVTTRDGSGGWSLDVPTPLAEGIYTVQAEQTDLAGNVGQSLAHTFEVDTTAPEPPTLESTPPAEGNDTSVQWAFSGEASAVFECRLEKGSTTISDWTDCDGLASYTLVDGDGTYTFSVRQTDPAGNTSDGASFDYLLDTEAPSVNITDAPASPGNDVDPVWSFASEPGSTTECSLDGPGGPVDPSAPCAGSYTFDLSGLPDGDYTFGVQATDTASNSGPPDTHLYTLDTTGPVVTIDTAPSSPGNAVHPAWDFSTEPGAATECELRDQTGVLDAFATCSDSYAFDLSGLADGDFTFSVRATDGLGNLGTASVDTYTLDTLAPSVTFVTVPGPVGGNPDPVWTFSTEPGATTGCELRYQGGVIDAFAPCAGSYTFDLSGRPDGTYVLSVVATDVAGNVGVPVSNTYVLDTSGPVISMISGPDATGNDPKPVWTFSVASGSTTTCQLNGPGGVVDPVAPCSGSYTFDLSSQPDGPYTLSVHATDQWGNAGSVFSTTYILDRSAPSVTITSSPTTPDNNRDPQWAFVTEAGATTECRLTRGASEIAPYSLCSSAVAYSLAGEPDGDYTIAVQATDVAGNTGTPATGTYRLDTIGPVVAITSAPTQGTDTTPRWRFTSENDASFECRVSKGGTVIAPYDVCSSPFTSDLTGRNPGTFTFSVRATDGVGNRGPASTADYVLKAPKEDEDEQEEDAGGSDGSGGADGSGGSNGGSGSGSGTSTSSSADDRESGGGGPDESRDSNDPFVSGFGATSDRDGSKKSVEETRKKDRNAAPEPEGGTAAVEKVAPSEAGSSEDAPDGRSLFTTMRTAAFFVAKGSAFPIALVMLVLGFLIFQDRVDRRDPKLALAPVHPDPYIDFIPG